MTAATVLEFLAWLASSSNRAPATVSAHYPALTDPLRFSLGVVVPQRELTLLFRGAKSRRTPHINRSLHRVLHYLSFEGVEVNLDLSLRRAVFLLELALGYRASQLAPLMRFPLYTRLAKDGLANNEQADSFIGPLRVPVNPWPGSTTRLPSGRSTSATLQNKPFA